MRTTAQLILLFSFATHQSHFRPIGIALSADGTLVVLDSEGFLLKVNAKERSLARIARVAGIGQADDLAICSTQADQVAVVTFEELAQRSSLAVEFSLSTMTRIGFRNLTNGLLSGVACNRLSGSEYLSDKLTPRIFSAPIGKNGTASEIMDIPRANRLGSMAIDENKRLLYVADFFSGQIFLCDLNSGASVLLAEGFGSIRSLALNSKGDQLYVGDAGKHCVSVLRVLAQGPRPSDVSVTEFHRGAFDARKATRFFDLNGGLPTGLAVTTEGDVWVADFNGGKVVKVSQAGKLIYEIQ